MDCALELRIKFLLNRGIIYGLYRDNGKENGNYFNGLYRDYRGLYWGNIGIMEQKMETSLMGYI